MEIGFLEKTTPTYNLIVFLFSQSKYIFWSSMFQLSGKWSAIVRLSGQKHCTRTHRTARPTTWLFDAAAMYFQTPSWEKERKREWLVGQIGRMKKVRSSIALYNEWTKKYTQLGCGVPKLSFLNNSHFYSFRYLSCVARTSTSCPTGTRSSPATRGSRSSTAQRPSTGYSGSARPSFTTREPTSVRYDYYYFVQWMQ